MTLRAGLDPVVQQVPWPGWEFSPILPQTAFLFSLFSSKLLVYRGLGLLTLLLLEITPVSASWASMPKSRGFFFGSEEVCRKDAADLSATRKMRTFLGRRGCLALLCKLLRKHIMRKDENLFDDHEDFHSKAG
jgi:hypothetical protein